jgi:hypothetical protein
MRLEMGASMAEQLWPAAAEERLDDRRRGVVPRREEWQSQDKSVGRLRRHRLCCEAPDVPITAAESIGERLRVGLVLVDRRGPANCLAERLTAHLDIVVAQA